MNDSTNGAPEVKQLPTLAVGWDQEAQCVDLQFDPLQFRTWDFVLAVLDMARQKAEQNKRVALMAQMQQKTAEEAQARIIAQQLREGRR